MDKQAMHLLAFDLGAESGRAILGKFNGECLELSEIHRFSNGPTRLPAPGGKQQLRWNVLNLWNEIQRGIAMASKSCEIAGIGIDTWGCDFGLFDRQDQLIGNPFHYRDDRTDGMLEEAFRRSSRQAIFAQTGIQFMQLNTLYQ
ncbi:MAG: FGGY family carbohydrate kinase, partial [Omnitrophica WOR_2 bacterium]